MKKGILLIALVLLLVIGEFLLRIIFGFTDAVLYREDLKIEYIVEPNQNRHRFGNSIRYNEHSMRSEPLKKESRRILGLGDSVLNGGVLCDQAELATYLLEKELNKELGQQIQVLNISTQSWGPDNAMAYLEKFGDFNAELFFLVTSSHDTYDTMDFSPVVGSSKNYPNQQYFLAYMEGVDRYLLPLLGNTIRANKEVEGGVEGTKKEKNFNTGFQNILDYSKKQNIPFILYLHPELSEVKKGSYNQKGKLILEFAKKNNIEVITGLEGARETHYLDNIHLNEAGQNYLFGQLYPKLKEIMSKRI